jgi:hypothetical protein
MSFSNSEELILYNVLFRESILPQDKRHFSLSWILEGRNDRFYQVGL